jgi:FXSXX-COOH protein
MERLAFRRVRIVDQSVGEVETELVDLSHVSLSALRDCDRSQLTSSLRRIVEQIDGARANIGSTGTPGRVD